MHVKNLLKYNNTHKLYFYTTSLYLTLSHKNIFIYKHEYLIFSRTMNRTMDFDRALLLLIISQNIIYIAYIIMCLKTKMLNYVITRLNIEIRPFKYNHSRYVFPHINPQNR